MPIEPNAQQMQDLMSRAGGDDDGPVVMLNLNRYKDKEAYGRYSVVALSVLERVGGRIQWYAEAGETVVGDESDVYDEVIAVWYPSRAAFVELATDEGIVAALEHRVAGLERAAIICCSA